MSKDAVEDTGQMGEGTRDSASDVVSDCPRASVLLVEDEALIAEIVGEILAESGYEVHAVGSAEEALAHLSAGAHVDVLFTDINLPGMDGATLAREARQSAPELPVIYASGRWGLLEDLRAQPHSEVLQKPYSPARACQAIERLMAKVSDSLDAKAGSPAALALAL